MWIEKKKKAFITVLSLSLVIYFHFRAKAYNLLLTFLQTLEAFLLKVSLSSSKTTNNFLEELLFISALSVLIEASPFEVSKNWDLFGLAVR